ncbi:hypothetical protein SLEP1_g31179 [Rubroshorea leprosula]|uniref:Kinetochore protein Nuf2 N-terminal domain-containing protein n=1 Tax=Rubroshorea leprosula TaxID=152421 RepID=A0AAV5KAG9_9ROSI|nr:hypothetical protein SLEP1_g31179 [Rubroshorea leprosula]
MVRESLAARRRAAMKAPMMLMPIQPSRVWQWSLHRNRGRWLYHGFARAPTYSINKYFKGGKNSRMLIRFRIFSVVSLTFSATKHTTTSKITEKMSKFEYPRLSRTDIITILKESQIVEVKENDLKNPNPDFVSDLYTRLLIYLDTLHEDEQGQVEFSALEQLENPDLHVGSVQVMNLYSRIKGIVASLDCPMQFNLKDLIRPDAARTEFFISTILNFCLHKDAKMNILRPIVEELADLDEQRNDWEAKISQLIAEIAGYNEAREKELPLVQEVDTKVKELQQTIAGLNGRQMLLKASYNKLKDKTKEIEKKISKAEFDLVQSVQENANLRSKIVQSPDKLQVLSPSNCVLFR